MYLRLKIYLFIASTTVLLVGCNNLNNKQEGGACEYVDLVEEYRIEKVYPINDTNYRVQFINNQSPEKTLALNSNQLKADIPEFNEEMMGDTSQTYIISLDVIISGSCKPEIIRGIKLKTD